MHPIGFQLLIIGQKGMIDVLVLKNTNRQLNLSILCTQRPLSEKHSRFILTQTHTTLKESDILDCPLHVDLQCSLIKKIFLPASPCVWWCYGGFIQCMVQNKKHQEHTEQQISPWASKIKWFRLLKCVCVCTVPLGVLIILHVEQHGGDEFIHVLRFPDDCLQFIIHSLSDNTLETLNACYTDPTARTC